MEPAPTANREQHREAVRETGRDDGQTIRQPEAGSAGRPSRVGARRVKLTRRQALRQAAERTAALALAAALPALTTDCRNAPRCSDPELWSPSEASLRETLHFTERSPHGAERACAGCQFFTGGDGAADACGQCQILQGPVASSGHCDSFAERPV